MDMPFIEENDQTRARREHLEAIRALIGNPYPNRFERSRVVQPPHEDTVTAVLEKFSRLATKTATGQQASPEEHEQANRVLNDIEVRIAGRIATPPRVMGKSAFVHLSDGVSRLQIYVRKGETKAVTGDNAEADGWQLLELLDHGDFIGVAGHLFVTKTGELSVHVRGIQFLAKALVPMPDKMHGVTDPEIRQRRRYVDLIAGSLKVEQEAGELTTREVFERRARLVREMRRFLDDHGFIEVETPMLTPLATGAAAKPFKTHHNALDIPLYARIAPELYLKRLVVGGFERVYELNRNFRNEGISTRHNPEFTMLEFYCAYMDVNGMMNLCEELLRTTVQQTIGSLCVRYGEHPIDLARPLERLTMKQAINRFFPEELRTLGDEQFDESWLDDPERLRQLTQFLRHYETRTAVAAYQGAETTNAAAEINKAHVREVSAEAWQQFKQVEIDEEDAADASAEAEMGRHIAELFEMLAEAELIQPTFITDFPKTVSPLAKASPANPQIAERFELFMAGMEVANGFSELNDPVEQYERFLEQLSERERGDEEAMPMDEDYLQALAYGMPPAAGIGIGIDRLMMILTNRQSIRDVILFPHMRPKHQADEQQQ
ncbi:MAG: lysine--tRNA ligase [Pyrinomonadaceae bacterium]|nr:lysine--tRNA ligase [Pyrinomonadaceae bacterium]